MKNNNLSVWQWKIGKGLLDEIVLFYLLKNFIGQWFSVFEIFLRVGKGHGFLCTKPVEGGVASDGEEPGDEFLFGIVFLQVFPSLEEGELGNVIGFFLAASEAIGKVVDSLEVARNEDLQGIFALFSSSEVGANEFLIGSFHLGSLAPWGPLG